MNQNNWELAKRLADRPYSITIEQDTLTDGRVVYLLRHPELIGCKAQGASVTEAKINLDSARIDYIYAMLEMGLPIPAPAATETVTNSSANSQTWKVDASSDEADIEDILDRVIRPDFRSEAVSISFGGDLVKRG
jgi:predicted RNase H-like HicB family nuclease